MSDYDDLLIIYKELQETHKTKLEEFEQYRGKI